MSYKLVERVLEAEGIDPEPKLALAIVARHAKDDGTGCTIGRRLIAKRMNISCRALLPHFAYLFRLALIESRRRFLSSDGSRRNDETIVNLEVLAQFDPVTDAEPSGKKFPVGQQQPSGKELPVGDGGPSGSFGRAYWKSSSSLAEVLVEPSGRNLPHLSGFESIKSGFESVADATAGASSSAVKPEPGLAENKSNPEPPPTIPRIPRRGDEAAIEAAARDLGIWPLSGEAGRDWDVAHDRVVAEIERRHSGAPQPAPVSADRGKQLTRDPEPPAPPAANVDFAALRAAIGQGPRPTVSKPINGHDQLVALMEAQPKRITPTGNEREAAKRRYEREAARRARARAKRAGIQ